MRNEKLIKKDRYKTNNMNKTSQDILKMKTISPKMFDVGNSFGKILFLFRKEDGTRRTGQGTERDETHQLHCAYLSRSKGRKRNRSGIISRNSCVLVYSSTSAATSLDSLRSAIFWMICSCSCTCSRVRCRARARMRKNQASFKRTWCF